MATSRRPKMWRKLKERLRSATSTAASKGSNAKSERWLSIETLECRRLLALNPTGDEQELMQLVNRFRSDPRGEFSRLISVASPIKARDPILQPDLDFAVVNGNTLRSELAILNPTPPVAWNEAISDFNRDHNADMIREKRHFHTNTAQRRAELIAAGVNFRFANGEKINSENVFGYGKSPLHIFAAYIIDWQRGGPGGMQVGRSHRAANLNSDFEQAGLAITNYSGADFGPRVNSQVLANIENPPIMVTGAIFQDNNNSGWYDSGEGIGSVRFVFQGEAGTFTTTGFGTGGYQIELPAGTYIATASGGGMKYTQRMSNIVVGDVNVWKNWIYDPDVIPPDALEANNSTGAATRLDATNQTLSGLTIHSASDIDYFRLIPNGTGQATVGLQFSQAAGDIDLQLLSSSGSVIASGTSATNNETLTASLVRGSTYFVKVFGKSGARNGNYALTVNPPAPAAPVAGEDRASLGGAASVVIQVLANDSDSDSAASTLTPKLAAGTHSAFSLTGKTVTYRAPAGYSGVHRANYTVMDDQGMESNPAEIAVFVVNFDEPTPWQNKVSNVDINSDGVTSPIDALLVVNELNQRESRRLPTNPTNADKIFGFVDASGDGFVTPLDALMVVNQLNGGGEGEAADWSATALPVNDRSSIDQAEVDAALYQLVSSEFWQASELKRERFFG